MGGGCVDALVILALAAASDSEAAPIPKVLDPKMEVQWGEGWQEMAKPVEFAQWYSGMEWHRATANALRTGMSGVNHLQQRVQQLTVLLARTEQALQSTQRLREKDRRRGQGIKQEQGQEQEQEQDGDDPLRELEEEQEAQMAALVEDRQQLKDQLDDLQFSLEVAINEKERAINEQQESAAAQYKMKQDMDVLRRELRNMKGQFDNMEQKLHQAVAKSNELEEEKKKCAGLVTALETQLAEQQVRCLHKLGWRR